MAYELVEEVLDHAPPDLTPAERLILVCIAEKCRRGNRRWPISGAELERRTGLTESGIRKAIRRLAEERRIEVRVALGNDRRGMPVYAVPGQVCIYQLPVFPPPAGCPCERCSEKAGLLSLLPEKEGPGGAQEGLWSRIGGTVVPAGGTVVPPKPSLNPSVFANDLEFADSAAARAHIRAVNTARTGKRPEDGPSGLPDALLAVGTYLSATIDLTGATVTVARTGDTTWRIAAFKMGETLYDAVNRTDQADAYQLAWSYCEELRQVHVNRTLKRSPITVETCRC